MNIEIRAYLLRDDGKLESFFMHPLGNFGGVCPNVGDTLCLDRAGGGPDFYSVQRRYFVDGRPIGWGLILRKLDAAAPLIDFAKEWEEETLFWNEVDNQEQAKDDARQIAIVEAAARPGKKHAHRANRLPQVEAGAEPQVFTPKTLAERWLCSERHVRNMVSRGQLKGFKHGGRLLRIRLEEVLRVENENASGHSPPNNAI